ncbi:hypothetical protein SARC_07627 [Sphaeroforma arctica JP610]|uniref:Uncharacterized protein n=1 Tax=Sphaeroforma arctica JP610 TaxID=667725 RepID=A0A0L0FT65_9EUKA|nr:hypothetical protein SARC_07627 [Sphaeroforma arctica JP610]KNC79995.1 hypothetical protein SARC_07627 [Sphaeroforma arctica JP610]|eukprot:XP_014153897.1 hypothetical protein SARC_07627 [Sphaeroforma arctica JP610]
MKKIFSSATNSNQFKTRNGRAMLWTGFPYKQRDDKEWGSDQNIQISKGKSFAASDRKAYGHTPILIAWDEDFLISVACVDNVRKPNAAGKLRWSGDTVILTMSGCGEYRSWSMGNGKDYWNALRLYALYMKDEHGLASRKSPSWALKPYLNLIVESMREYVEHLPLQGELHIRGYKQIGADLIPETWHQECTEWLRWLGSVRWGMDTRTVNRKRLVSVNKFKQFNKTLKSEVLRTIVWGALMANWEDSPISSTVGYYSPAGYSPISSQISDDYLLKGNSKLQQHVRDTVKMLKGWGVPGLKADDVSELTYRVKDTEQREWTKINHSITKENSDFAYLRCACGLMQGFMNNIVGMNSIVTSDPTGQQLRHRIKAINALNLGGAAILGDYIEVNTDAEADGQRSRVQGRDLYDALPNGYLQSVIGLGAVLQTKCSSTQAPKSYEEWFKKYHQWQLSDATKTAWKNHQYLRWKSDEKYEVSRGDLRVVTKFKDSRYISTTEM